LRLAKLLLNEITSPDQIMELDQNSSAVNANRLYLRRLDSVSRKNLKTLCALASFDINPLTEYVDTTPKMLDLGLVNELYSPFQIMFCDSSLAGILYYTLIDKYFKNDKSTYDWNEALAIELLEYLKHIRGSNTAHLNPFFLEYNKRRTFFAGF
jgi:hypothetical protein